MLQYLKIVINTEAQFSRGLPLERWTFLAYSGLPLGSWTFLAYSLSIGGSHGNTAFHP